MANQTKRQASQADALMLREYVSRPDLVQPGSQWWWACLAAVFLPAGLAIVLIAPELTGKVGVIRGIGVTFILIGLSQLDTAIRALRLKGRERRLRRQFGNAPWTRHYPWDATGHSDGSWSMMLRHASAGLFFFAMCNAGGVMMLTGYLPSNSKVICGVALAFLISLLFLYFLTIKKVWHWMKFGSSRLVFGHVPYELGSELKAQLVPGRIIRYSKLQFTLRCIQPCCRTVKIRHGTRIKHSTSTAFRQVYADRVEINCDGEWRPGLSPIPLAFELPHKHLPTNLDGAMARLTSDDDEEPVGDGMRYWELEVRAFQPGLDYKASFLVPVYERAEAEARVQTGN
jgi:hypothetical protein